MDRASKKRPRRIRGTLMRAHEGETGGSGGDAAEAEILDLQELLDAVLRASAAGAVFRDADEGRPPGRDDPLVEADDAVCGRPGTPPHAIDVAAVEIGGEAEFGVVRHLDRLRLGL